MPGSTCDHKVAPAARIPNHEAYTEAEKVRVRVAIDNALKVLREERTQSVSEGKKPRRIFKATILDRAKVDKNTLEADYHKPWKDKVTAFLEKMNPSVLIIAEMGTPAVEKSAKDELKLLRDRNYALELAAFERDAR